MSVYRRYMCPRLQSPSSIMGAHPYVLSVAPHLMLGWSSGLELHWGHHPRRSDMPAPHARLFWCSGMLKLVPPWRPAAASLPADTDSSSRCVGHIGK